MASYNMNIASPLRPVDAVSHGARREYHARKQAIFNTTLCAGSNE